MSYDEIRESFSEEHAPRRGHDDPWINLPSVGSITATVAKRLRRTVEPFRYLSLNDVVYAVVCKVQALRLLLSSTP